MCNAYCFPTATMVLRTRLNVTFMSIACLGKRQVTKKDNPCCYEVWNILHEQRISWFMQITYYYYYYHRHRNHPHSLLRSSLPSFQKSVIISDFSAQNVLYYCYYYYYYYYYYHHHQHHFYAQYLLLFTVIYQKQILFLQYTTLQLFCGYKIWYM